MPRQPLIALGLVALALASGPVFPPRAAAAQAPHKEGPPAVGKAAAEVKDAAHAAGEALKEAGHELESGGEHEGKPNILQPQPKLAIWTVVVFLGLLFVLGRFAWKPLLAALHQREEHLEHVLLETERARNESEKLLAEHRRRLAAAEDQVRALIEEARKSAQAAADEISRRAQEEAEATKHRAERDISTARDQALSEIWSKTADLAVSVAGKVLGKSLTEDDHRRLVDSAIGELNATSNGHGGARS
jgi:F-type H+-transporting ATPase subunit b